jgi:uncharacterized protein YjiS (DUF1127 family)
MLYYLKRAFPATRRQILDIQSAAPGAILPLPTDESSAMVIASGAQTADRLRFLRGKLDLEQTVLLVLRDASDAATLARMIAWPRVRRRDSRRRLAELDACERRDIGMTYADAWQESSKPFWRA